jgi:hypothetical protein
LVRLRKRCELFIEPDNILTACADPRPEPVTRIDEASNEVRTNHSSSPDISILKTRLGSILEKEGNPLMAYWQRQVSFLGPRGFSSNYAE